jgi:hypothetical protein
MHMLEEKPMTSGINLSQYQLDLLRATGPLISSRRSHEAARHIYAEFARLHGGAQFVYEVETRIRSTAKLIDFLVSKFETMPFGTDRIDKMFEAVGASHARAGLPVALLEAGPEIFASSLAKAVHEDGDSWTSDYSAAWRELMQQGIEIQKRSYA